MEGVGGVVGHVVKKREEAIYKYQEKGNGKIIYLGAKKGDAASSSRGKGYLAKFKRGRVI